MCYKGETANGGFRRVILDWVMKIPEDKSKFHPLMGTDTVSQEESLK